MIDDENFPDRLMKLRIVRAQLECSAKFLDCVAEILAEGVAFSTQLMRTLGVGE